MHHSTFIGHLASIYKPKVYVELGLYEGETFQLVRPHATSAYGVDIKANAYLERLKQYNNVSIHYSRTEDFFSSFVGGIDMAFIDADHCLESVKKDFNNILSRLNPGGIILLHDTDPDRDGLIRPEYCGDAYKIIPILEDDTTINVTTLPLTDAGLSIVTKKASSRKQLRG
jgi:hypothetical protein